MADTHYVTNRGKYLIASGDFATNPTTYSMGLIDAAAKPAAIDTEAEIQDLNFVSELLAATGVDEPTVGGYARVALSSFAATEDDTNNRVGLDVANVSFGALATGANIIGGFVFKNTGADDTARQLVSVFLRDTATPTNGATHTENVTDLYRVS